MSTAQTTPPRPAVGRPRPAMRPAQPRPPRRPKRRRGFPRVPRVQADGRQPHAAPASPPQLRDLSGKRTQVSAPPPMAHDSLSLQRGQSPAARQRPRFSVGRTVNRPAKGACTTPGLRLHRSDRRSGQTDGPSACLADRVAACWFAPPAPVPPLPDRRPETGPTQGTRSMTVRMPRRSTRPGILIASRRVKPQAHCTPWPAYARYASNASGAGRRPRSTSTVSRS